MEKKQKHREWNVSIRTYNAYGFEELLWGSGLTLAAFCFSLLNSEPLAIHPHQDNPAVPHDKREKYMAAACWLRLLIS